VKIADFGIALSDNSSDRTPGEGGILMATPRYMSPEQAGGTEPDARSDLFSLGLVLYEMITGRKAFEADTLTALIAQIEGEEPAPITDLAPDAPPGLQKIVAKLLQKKPDRRFQSAGELALALAEE
jgi:serine/threonine-protein kinase